MELQPHRDERRKTKLNLAFMASLADKKEGGENSKRQKKLSYSMSLIYSICTFSFEKENRALVHENTVYVEKLFLTFSLQI